MGAAAAHHAVLFQLAVRAGGALHAIIFPLAVQAWVARRAVIFHLAVRISFALPTPVFHIAVRAGVALQAFVFHLPVRAWGAHRTLVFQLTMRAPVALHAVAFQLAVRAPFPFPDGVPQNSPARRPCVRLSLHHQPADVGSVATTQTDLGRKVQEIKYNMFTSRTTHSPRARARVRSVMSGMRITLERLGIPGSVGFQGDETAEGNVTWSVSDGGGGDDEEVGTIPSAVPPPPTQCLDDTRPPVLPNDSPYASSSSAPRPAKLAILVPFREDGTGREAQLQALLARLQCMFAGNEICVLIATQSNDDRKFNRGQLLNCAFEYVISKEKAWTNENTLFCFHDCDMLPHVSLAKHYLRQPPECGDCCGDEKNDDDKNNSPGLVRVLSADGGRYDVDGCFGGVTVYSRKGFELTNGYPNGFWGWGGEDNAQKVRCARKNLWIERVRECVFDDLEGLDTVTEKLQKLNQLNSRCPSKEKRKLLSENARSWKTDGLSSLEYDAFEVLNSSEDEKTKTESLQTESKKALRTSRVVFTLKAGIRDEITCSACGIRKGPSGFASHQHRRAMFFAKRDKKPKAEEEEDDFSQKNKPLTEKEIFWREENRRRRMCHWDERGGEGESSGEAQTVPSVSLKSVSTALPVLEEKKDSKHSAEKKTREEKAAARCLECVAKDPKVSLFRKQAEANRLDKTRVSCCRCATVFDKRNKLFEHLKTTACGIDEGGVIEGHAQTLSS